MIELFIEKATQAAQELFVIPVTLHSLVLDWVVNVLQALDEIQEVPAAVSF